MIHYHGGPITPEVVAADVWQGRHALVSFAHPEQMEMAAEVSQSFCLDNGAFTVWKQGGTLDVKGYAAWVEEWYRHPGFDFALIPDAVDGDEAENDHLIAMWHLNRDFYRVGVPVWHLHESLSRLQRLGRQFQRVALGSSGSYATPNTEAWWGRMAEVMQAVCDERGRPMTKLHGLRMLDSDIYRYIPLTSADSTNVARNIGIDSRWKGTYTPMTKRARAAVLVDRIEFHNSASAWISQPIQEGLFV